MSGKEVCYVLALVFFVFGAIRIPLGTVNWTDAGYAALTASLLV